MKKLSIEQMEVLNGGMNPCAGTHARGMLSTIGFAATFGGPKGIIAVGAVILAVAAYDHIRCVSTGGGYVVAPDNSFQPVFLVN